jgi:hypothetical protein
LSQKRQFFRQKICEIKKKIITSFPDLTMTSSNGKNGDKDKDSGKESADGEVGAEDQGPIL